ncbi:MAG: orotate phosphoribosyltransferase [SAR86 cluster bacterium]|nr:orotate phosphoribosyltransferase [SAR86 cluster bacterium]|tara:strand:- start:1155 stop:1784 length:630 start_codon:yes stop_codon:yes gene_type:complete
MKKKEDIFFELALESNSLTLGDFTLKSGKKSPYFFNIGSFFNEGHIGKLAELYADVILDNGQEFDLIFGPAYKGIPLAAAISTTLSLKSSKSIPFAFDRKEEKLHGEGGSIVGELTDKRVLIVDDVLTAGTALKQSIKTIQHYGGKIVGSLVALDREEILEGVLARNRILDDYGVEVMSIARISQLIDFFTLSNRKEEANTIKNYLKGL